MTAVDETRVRMTRDELLAALLRERFGKPVRGPTWPKPPADPWHPPPTRRDDAAVRVRRYELDVAINENEEEGADGTHPHRQAELLG